MTYPLAYIRRSVTSKADPGDVSREFQTTKVKVLSGDDADSLTIIDADWGISAGYRSLARRTGFADMLARIGRGEVSTLYAYSLDRLARDIIASETLLRLCREHGVTIATGEGRYAPGDEGAALAFRVVATMNQTALEGMERKAEATAKVVKSRAGTMNPKTGLLYERTGRKNYGADPNYPNEDPAVVLRAFASAGSFLGAAKRLNAQGTPTRTGGAWDARTVSRIVRRMRPDVAHRPHARRGESTIARHVFSGLLRCACGQTLTTMPRPDGRAVAYYCRRAHRTAEHSRPYVISENKVRGWAQAELEKMEPVLSISHPTGADDSAARLADIRTRRERVIDLYVNGVIEKPDRDARLAGLDDERIRAEATQVARGATLRSGPYVDWDAAPGEVNQRLRTVWQYIVLNGGMMPKYAQWWPTDDWDERGPE